MRSKHTLFLLLATAALFAGFRWNLWRVAEPRWFAEHQRDAESEIMARLVQSRQAGILSEGGLVGYGSPTTRRLLYDDKPYDYQYQAYLHGGSFKSYTRYKTQVGGQGMLFSLLDRVLPAAPAAKVEIYRALTALPTALALALVALWFALEFNLWVGGVVALSMIAAPWLTIFGRNLFWGLWSFYLPMLALMYYLRRAKTCDRRRRWTLWAMVFAAVIVKCFICGYEYITTTLIMMVVPFVYYAVKERWGLKRLTHDLLLSVIVSVAAVGLMALILCAQIGQADGDWMKGVDHLITSFNRRSFAVSGEVSPDYKELAPSLLSNPVAVVRLYFTGVTGRGPLQHAEFLDLGNYFPAAPKSFLAEYILKVRYMYLVGLYALASGVLALRLWRDPESPRRLGAALIAATWFSILAPLSWLIIFKAHAYLHTHLDYLTWQMPFTFFGFAVCALAVTPRSVWRERSYSPSAPGISLGDPVPLRSTRALAVTLIATAVLFAGCFANSFHVADAEWFRHFQRDGESHVISRLAQSRQAGPFSNGALIGIGLPPASHMTAVFDEDDDDLCDYAQEIYLAGARFGEFSPYCSQIGAQGLLYSALDRVAPGTPATRLRVFHGLSAFLSAGALALLVLWFATEFNLLVAASVLLSIVGCHWFIGFAKNLFWSLWAFYVPLVALLYYLQARERRPARGRFGLGAVIAAGVLLKCAMNGYEYLTTALIMLVVPLVYYGLKRARPWRLIAGDLAFACAVAGVAVMVSGGILCAQIAAAHDGRLADGFHHIVHSLNKRTYGMGGRLSEQFPVLRKSLEAGPVEVVVAYLAVPFHDFGRWIPHPRSAVWRDLLKVRYVHLLGLLLLASLILDYVARRPGVPRDRRTVALLGATWFSLLAPLSWLIIFKAHSYVHIAMNPIVWQMPFTLFGFALIGWTIHSLTGPRAR